MTRMREYYVTFRASLSTFHGLRDEMSYIIRASSDRAAYRKIKKHPDFLRGNRLLSVNVERRMVWRHFANSHYWQLSSQFDKLWALGLC